MSPPDPARAFDEELGRLRRMVGILGELAVDQLSRAIESLSRPEGKAAAQIVTREPDADRLEHEIDEFVIRELALRQPVAVDLRDILAALRIANELERICDHAEHMAERTMALRSSPIRQLISLRPLAQFATAMVADVMNAYKSRDAAKAQDVWSRDEQLDAMYSQFFRELLTYMMEEPRQVANWMQLVFMARDIERIGDHATNIAEMVRFLLGGRLVEEARPKADVTRSIVTSAADPVIEGT